MTEARLYTSSWAAALREPHVQPVAISLGLPKWLPTPAAESLPAVESLMPFGLLTKPPLPPDEFERRYLGALDGRAHSIERQLSALPSGRPALLCCFERDPADCHRSLAASWLKRNLGLEVPEWTPTAPVRPMPAQLALDLKEE